MKQGGFHIQWQVVIRWNFHQGENGNFRSIVKKISKNRLEKLDLLVVLWHG